MSGLAFDEEEPELEKPKRKSANTYKRRSGRSRESPRKFATAKVLNSELRKDWQSWPKTKSKTKGG